MKMMHSSIVGCPEAHYMQCLEALGPRRRAHIQYWAAPARNFIPPWWRMMAKVWIRPEMRENGADQGWWSKRSSFFRPRPPSLDENKEMIPAPFFSAKRGTEGIQGNLLQAILLSIFVLGIICFFGKTGSGTRPLQNSSDERLSFIWTSSFSPETNLLLPIFPESLDKYFASALTLLPIGWNEDEERNINRIKSSCQPIVDGRWIFEWMLSICCAALALVQTESKAVYLLCIWETRSIEVEFPFAVATFVMNGLVCGLLWALQLEVK